jgi:hypothetical protein
MNAIAGGLRAMFRPPAWVTGGISTGDAEYLAALVAEAQPEIVVEIGVAAGTSSAALLFALDQLPDLPGRRQLWSVDIRSACYFDRQHLTGAATLEMYPAPRSVWILDVGCDARRLRASLRLGSVGLIFVDGNHDHPWPLLDVLHLAPYLKPGAWIALHDIALPRLFPQYQTFGPTWLFERWPLLEKRQGVDPDAQNTGAIRLPADLRDLIPVALDLLQRHPWETIPTRADVDLPDVFAPVSAALKPRLRP